MSSGRSCLAGTPPSERQEHSVVVYDTKAVIFAGNYFDGSSHHNKNDLFFFDFTTNAWSSPTLSGTPPSQRQNPSAAIDNSTGTMYVYGGLSRSTGGWTILQFDINLLSWHLLPQSNVNLGPGDRASGVMKVNKSSLLFFVDAVLGMTVRTLGDLGSGFWSTLSTSGTTHGLEAPDNTIWGEKWYFFGGLSDKVSVLDLVTLEWSNPQTTGAGPSSRYGSGWERCLRTPPGCFRGQ